MTRSMAETVLGPRVWAAVAAVAAAQTAILLFMVWDRVQLLRTGREITLETVPVDPRSLFRGDYVRLGYDIGRVDAKLADEPALQAAQMPRENAIVYVSLKRGADGKWKPSAISRLRPAAPKEADVLVIKGRTEHSWINNAIGVRYGIEKFFVPENSGRELEAMARDRTHPLTVVVAVDGQGNAAIKRIAFEGRVLKEERPLW